MSGAPSPEESEGADEASLSQARQTDQPAQTETAQPRSTTGPLDRFSLLVRKVLAHAEDEARQQNHSQVRPEHVLLALLAFGPRSGAGILAGAGVDPREVREAAAARSVASTPTGSRPELAAETKRVVELALEEARRQGHRQVDVEHLVAALVREGSAMGPDVLSKLALRGLFLSGAMRPTRMRKRFSLTTMEPPTALVTRDNVLSLRIGDAELAAVDALVDIGVAKSRSEAAAWLLSAGIKANEALFEKSRTLLEEVRRLREEAQRLAQAHVAEQVGEELPSATQEARAGGSEEGTF